MEALADVCERIAERSIRLEKVAILAEYVAALDLAYTERTARLLRPPGLDAGAAFAGSGAAVGEEGG